MLPSVVLAVLLAPVAVSQGSGNGVIVRPPGKSAFAEGELSIVAGAPGGTLELDGKTLEANQPFPNILQVTVAPSPGRHTLVLTWDGGRVVSRFFVGSTPPEGYQTYQAHPPAPVDCTHCHGLSRRGRFRFQGGCDSCHAMDSFIETHDHQFHVLEQCGMCHEAHGSTAKALLKFPKETACKQCHN